MPCEIRSDLMSDPCDMMVRPVADTLTFQMMVRPMLHDVRPVVDTLTCIPDESIHVRV
jgi:hypothetical protein